LIASGGGARETSYRRELRIQLTVQELRVGIDDGRSYQSKMCGSSVYGLGDVECGRVVGDNMKEILFFSQRMIEHDATCVGALIVASLRECSVTMELVARRVVVEMCDLRLLIWSSDLCEFLTVFTQPHESPHSTNNCS